LDLRPALPAFLLGFMASSFQLYLLREFSAHFFGNELVFGLFLGSWLLWGGLGSLARPAARPSPRGLAVPYALIIGAFFAGLALLRFSHKIIGILPGEMTGLAPALAFSLALAFLLSFPLGHFFVLNSGLLGGNVPRVYFLESLGAAASGLLVHFLLVPRLSNWEGAAVVSAAAVLLIFAGLRPARGRALLVLLLILAAAVARLDLPTQKAAWKPLTLVEAEDTPYGKLQVLRTEDQTSLLANGLPLFSSPDPAGAEEAVHFALLQRTDPRRVLLIGGAAGGAAAEVLKHRGAVLDCVELDPAVIRLAGKHLPEAEFAPLRDPRVRIFVRDGRAFLEHAPGDYDAILLDLPEPATAMVNRYYTREFFREVRGKLAPGGVFGFRVPSAENYISADLARFLASLTATLQEVFSRVLTAPGANCVFLASDGPLSLDPAALAAAAERRGIAGRHFTPEMLAARLHPARVGELASRIGDAPARVNLDLVPVSYYFHSILWAGRFSRVESGLLRSLSDVPASRALDIPLAAFALVLAFLALSRRARRRSRYLMPVAGMGLTSMLVEMTVLVAFQASFGYVYGKVVLLLAAFMAGLAAGSGLAQLRDKAPAAALVIIQGGFLVLLLGSRAALGASVPEFVPYLLLLCFGVLGGSLFVVANRRLLLEGATHLGLGYGVDLLGSFLGVLLAAAVIIPLWGIPALLARLTALNALIFAFVLATSLRPARNG
jgi:spermidine synthase